MKNLIFCAFAQDNNKKTGANISSNCCAKDIYTKNLIVSLISAKTNNPNCDVALIANFCVPDKVRNILTANAILIFEEPFDNFYFADDYKWGLAFYKLNALEKVLSKDYDNYLLLDIDTYTQSSLDDLWLETQHNIMLYDINHRLANKNCTAFNKEVESFCNEKGFITNYGGEFIAGSHELLVKFIHECRLIYKEILEKDFVTSYGDEFIICIAASRMRVKVKNAGPYIYRFWTGSFRLISTCYEYNAVSVLHVPIEKEKGMLKLYSYFIKHNRLPQNNKAWKMLSLSKVSLKTRFITW